MVRVRSRRQSRWLALSAALVAVSLVAACSSSSSKSSAAKQEQTQGPVRGFDGTAIKVASIGIKGQLPGVEWGAKARIQRFNATNEIKGVSIDYTEYVDDKFDPAVTLSEFRRFVTEAKLFAVVGDVSAVNPGSYIKQQHLPVFGSGFDNSYCSAKPDPTIYSFGFIGCLVPDKPTKVPDYDFQLYNYASKELGTEHPTAVLFNTDTESGHNSSNNAMAALEGDGFETLPALPIIPPPPVSDYTPYVQKVLTADHGHAPQVVICMASSDCVPMWIQMKAAGFKGIYYHTIYADALAKPMAGTVVGVSWANFNDATPGMQQLKDDVKAAKADQALDLGVAWGYFTTDMFISALKKAYAKDGKAGITPEKVQAAASTMTWGIKGVVGPSKFPDSTVLPTPACGSLAKSDGVTWQAVQSFNCSTHTFAVH